jgi:membrane associated rhomboid family serine protease
VVPSDQNAVAYITYQFMHGGWMHLIFNLLFLYLAGPYIEDVWGRPFFAAFYLGAGVLSALFYVLKYPTMDAPLIGASGAIAGVMGAFLIRHGKTKIKFMMMILLRVQIIDLPAWIMLPLWVLRELFFGQAVDLAGGEGTGVAHWAHVAGFVVGVVVALAVRQFNFEKKVEAKFVHYENTTLDEALEAVRNDEKEKAAELLKQRLQEAPTDMDAAAAYWDVQRDIGDVTPAVQPLMRACREALRDGQEEFVATRWNEILDKAPPGSIDPMTAVRVGEILGKDLFPEVLLATVAAGVQGARPNTPPMVLARLARVGAKVGGGDVVGCAERALESDTLPDEMRADLEAIVNKAQALPPASGDATQAQPDSPTGSGDISGPVQHRLKVMDAVPEAWDNQKLTITVKGASRRMSMAQVQAIGVAGIAAAGGPPYVVVDLLLDAPWSDREALRVVRLRSNTFDPKTLIPTDDPQTSFRAVIESLLHVSGAVPLPDPEAVLGRPFRRFASIAEYEAEVLGVGGDLW